MGGAGTAVALETADVALMADDLAMLPFAVGLSRQNRSHHQTKLRGLDGSHRAACHCHALAGWAGIGTAVLLHEGSTMVVVVNSCDCSPMERGIAIRLGFSVTGVHPRRSHGSFTAHWSRNMTMLCVTLAVAVWVGLWLALR